VSNGRAEVILGRGSFTESFPLFGYELDQYEELFEEKLDLFAQLLTRAAGHLERRHASRAARPAGVPPHRSAATAPGSGMGGSPQSVVRAARYGCR
jgi:alkanesulfonate monooxygenase SsuD/methylene tetrahydromethanopterin reductase-like flavin-dependent oxidoreductase (luciferase family)